MNLVHTLPHDIDMVTYAAFSTDGKYLVTVRETAIVQIFDVQTGKRLR